MGSVRPIDPAVVRDLADVVGPRQVVTDPALVAGYTTDWTGRFAGRSPAVVRPARTEEVAAVLAVCNRRGVRVVPQGGNTGLVGGGVPLEGEIVLSLRRLSEIGEVDHAAAQLIAGAGVPIAAVQAAAVRGGLAYPVDLAARDSATVGGSVATNAGGLHFLRYGGTRERLVGIEAVTADGRVLRHLGGLLKDNTGYDLARLFCGSEGTLGVVTEAALALSPRFDHRVTALLAFGSVSGATEAAAALKRTVDSLEALEVFFDDGLRLVCEAFALRPPFDEEFSGYLLVEAADRADPSDTLSEAIDSLEGVMAVAVASAASRRRELWRYREDHTAAINGVGVPHKLDVTVPLGRLSAFLDEVRVRVHATAPEAQTWLFGHAGDGNVHVNVTGVAPDDDAVDDAVLELVAHHGGSISAEHGIGSAKKRWLHLSRSPEEIAVMRAIKDALDPNGILNPNAVLP
jgi:FAD/FMN-containing dehydrogenase